MSANSRLDGIKEALAYGGDYFGGYREELKWLVSEVERLTVESNHWRRVAAIGEEQYMSLLVKMKNP